MKKRNVSVWIMICILFTMAGHVAMLPVYASSQNNMKQLAGSSLQQDSAHTLASGTARTKGIVKWIDCVKLPAYAGKFYQVLEESTDNDGKKDYLIMDKYFKPGKAKSSLPQKPKLYQVTRTQTETGMLIAKFEGKQPDTDTILKNIRTAFNLFELDHPEVFWLCGESDLQLSTILKQSPEKSISYIHIKLKQFGPNSFDMRRSYTQKTIRSNISKMEKSIIQIENGLPGGGIYEKVKYFNNWLAKHNDNNYTNGKISDNSWKSISALLGSTVKKGPVCLGYASAMKVLCDRADIPCIIVSTADLSAYQAWNYVQIDQLWYAVDVTRNDPSVVDQNGNRIIKADSGYEREDYLLAGTDTKDSNGEIIKKSHPLTGLKYALPAHMTLSKKQYTASQHAEQPNIEDYVNGFYEMLEESTDHDGINDYLIKDEYFLAGNENKSVNDLDLYQVVHSKDKAWMLVAKAPADQASWLAAQRRLAKVYDAFSIDHPEVFWLCGWSDAKFETFTSAAYGQTAYIILTLKSYGEKSFDMRGNYTEKSIQADIAKLDQSVTDILNDMPNGSDAEKVRYFNNWLTKHNDCCSTVDKEVPLFSNKSISALFGSTGANGPVCTGYTGALKVLCDRAGIPCLFAVGYMGDGNGYHAWNYVQIEQLWYAVDVTWNDPGVLDQNGNRKIQADSGREKEEYLLVGSETRNSQGKSFTESHKMQSTQLENYVSAFAPRAEWSKNAYGL